MRGKQTEISANLRHIFRVFAKQGGEARGLEEAAEELMFVAEIDEKSEGSWSNPLRKRMRSP
ncbi:hypothetical protein ACNJYC_11285 [Bradyrhizobium sp. DASA03007]